MAKTTIPSELIADNAVGITQLNVSDGSNGQALVTNGSGTLSFASVGVSGISSSADATAITIDSSEDVTFAGAVTSTGKITADAGIDIDNFNIDGTTIALAGSSDMTLDSGGRIDLSADDNGEVRLFDGSSMYAQFKDDDDRLAIQGLISDKDLIISVNDGGSLITALRFDASDAGTAIFNNQVQAAPLGVSTPSYSFSNDTNTGMTRPTGDTLQFVTGGSARFRINSSGHLVPENQHTYDIGGTNAEVRNVYAQGISFASNANASGMTSELLDDYEEGTFTPTFAGATLSAAEGLYTKIGNQVTVHYRVVTTGGLPSSGGQVSIDNLPFTIASSFAGAGSLYVGPSNVSSATGGGGTIVTFVSGGETKLRFVNVDTGTLGYTLWGELEVSSNNVVTAIGTHTYQV